MTEYKYWEGNMTVKRKSLPEIRRHFIQHHLKNAATNIFASNRSFPAGRIYYAGGTWNYLNYTNHSIYILDDNGKVAVNLGKHD